MPNRWDCLSEECLSASKLWVARPGGLPPPSQRTAHRSGHDVKSVPLGLQILLDDFGTGFSSLSHRHNSPLDVLKIDRSFVKDLPAADAGITEAILSLGNLLKPPAQKVSDANRLVAQSDRPNLSPRVNGDAPRGVRSAATLDSTVD
ncbi:MAG: EAL domain-containing protein [Actinobacteria bacterium]|nr:EAL domain-containing protein [Actinomycetota bacterium]